ncbi:hypothetical protein ACFPM0_22110 [Pseudonocardia sulfidoxydans]|uniref:hypothetical protein n=1 Tax=Pseudonocardia sulfidoxydans TaxID=54011 RepID=UPI0036223A29
MATQSVAPQSASRHASLRIRAACAGDGGRGFPAGAAGGSPCPTGLAPTHRQRTAFR